MFLEHQEVSGLFTACLWKGTCADTGPPKPVRSTTWCAWGSTSPTTVSRTAAWKSCGSGPGAPGKTSCSSRLSFTSTIGAI